MEQNISLAAAFVAGLLSFVSPCVLPLLSSYLLFISGNKMNMHAPDGEKKSFFSKDSREIVISTFFFVLGFSCVFIILSVVLSSLFFFLGGIQKILNIIAGCIVVILGANILFNFIPFLKYDDSSDRCETCMPRHSILSAKCNSIVHPSRRPHGVPGSFLAGLAFGAGWTPCVGAFLGSILLMASQSGQMINSVIYLAVYSAGLALPFLIASFFWGVLIDYISKIRRILPVVRIVSGVFLIAVGVLMLSGRFRLLSGLLQSSVTGI